MTHILPSRGRRALVASVVGLGLVAGGLAASPASADDLPRLAFDARNAGDAIGNKFSELSTWNFNADWTTLADSYPDDYFADNYPEVETLSLMTATGGCYVGYPGCGDDRDLFIDPSDTSVLDDYDFSRLLHALRNVVRMGITPYISVGNVPIKFTASPHIGAYGVNVRPPDDYEVYADYVRAMAQAAVDEFGLAEVRTWPWRALTEYENGDWFRAADGTAASTKQAYFDLYDYTADALEDVLGVGQVRMGAHSMTNGDGLWDEKELIAHVASGTNAATGGIGAPISFLAFSYYDVAPGQGAPAPYTFEGDLAELRDAAESHGLMDLEYGIDEGRMLNGSDGRELDPRSVAWSYQSSLDAQRYIFMAENDMDYMARWYVNTDRYFGTDVVNPVESNFANLAHRLSNSAMLERTLTPTARNIGNEINGIAGYDEDTGTYGVLVYNHDMNPAGSAGERFTTSIDGVVATGAGVTVRSYRIDDDNANFWPTWAADMATRGMGSSSFGTRWSKDTWTIPSDLVSSADRAYWYSRVPTYQGLAQLQSVTESATLAGGTLTLATTELPAHGVMYYEITGIEPQAPTTASPITATGEDYAEYSMMFGKNAGQAWSGGSAASQWAWLPSSATESAISWGVPSAWPPSTSSRFIRSGDWVELEGWGDKTLSVTSQSIGNGSCANMNPLAISSGRQKYVAWDVSSTAYCLDARGTIATAGSTATVEFRHKQVWERVACGNAYFSGDTCLKQTEWWWDDDGHAYSLRTVRENYIAKGKGMAYKVQNRVSNGVFSSWSADGRYYWPWT